MSEHNQYHLLEQILEKTHKLVFSFDVDAGAFTYINSAFELVWNHTKEQLLANPGLLLDTIHPEDKDFLLNEIQDLLNGEPKEELEFRIMVSGNEEKSLLLSPLVLKDERGHVVVTGLAEDITSKKDNIANLQRFAAKKNSILEILSHDLAGPLASIQSISGSLAESLENRTLAEEDKNLINLIYKTSARSIQMIREFVKQEFLESSNADMFKVRLNLVEKLKEVVDQYKEGESHINKHFTFTASSPQIYVSIDQNKLMQVVNNLISNSIKFSKDYAHIDLSLTEQEDTVLITVKDDGIGIPEQYHDELFDKFTRARRNGLKGEPSVGLGMSLAKTIVEWHQGKIWFESQENKGTTFYIELPKD
ncbi:phosphate regulon sensor protein PhoR [Rufibacter sp. DG15C]|uniref:PAS domain-containing sensor histidine kinase n=1 Tax=Rufibacter sp. DG15C TaxID=1379909 RepID=UPI00078B2726|nr:ATP-binding protein [Rufibacter sp. DG15C]AMM52481.1 phosphate regulon sensor protein PhoR [Rufibacter sp. DG15C]